MNKLAWVFLYILGASLIIAFGLNNAINMHYAAHIQADPTSMAALGVKPQGFLFNTFAIIFTVYNVRYWFLFSPVLFLSKKWHDITTYGFLAAIIPEIVIINSAIGMLRETADTCEVNTFGGCGSAVIALVILVAISIVVQIVGSLIGLVVAMVKKD